MESLHAAARCSAPQGAGNNKSAVLGSRAYRNHSTRLRDFPLPRGEGRCELVRACFRNPPKRRVRARGLQETMRFRHPCRPGPLTGRFSKHALRKYAKRVKDRDRLTARSGSSSRREEALHRFCFRGNLSLVTSAATGSGVFKPALLPLSLSTRVLTPRRRCW